MKKNNLTVLNKIYKPYKYTIKNQALILYCDDRNIVLKPKNENLKKYHNYMIASNFDNFLPIIDDERDNYFVYEYKDDLNVPIEEKNRDFVKTVSLLHAKTTYKKSIDLNRYDEIYDNLNNNIKYLKDKYSKMYDDIFPKKYYCPHEYLFMDYYSKIDNNLSFLEAEVNNWFSMVSNKKNQRVSLVHNNLDISHFIKSDKDYLISFDNAKIDTPIIDLVNLYQKMYNKTEFSVLLEEYLYHYSLEEDELKLFFILISMPPDIKIESDNFLNTEKVYYLVNYINKVEELIRPYYSNDKKIEKA